VKRVISMLVLTLICILLGVSLDYMDDGETTLVSEYEWRAGGIYE
jgi:hypothetical protein